MDQLVVRENVRRFRDCLSWEVKPDKRALLQKLLVEEEDKLGVDLESLGDVQQHILDCYHRIERQRALVTIMERYGYKGLHNAQVLLDGLLQTQVLHKYYYQQLLIKITHNRARPIR